MGIGSDALNPIDNAAAWDVIRIGDVQSPGKCVLSGIKRAHEWDVKKGKGVKGGTTTFVGLPPAKFTATFTLGFFRFDGSGGAQDFTDWARFRTLLQYDPTRKAPKAVDIYHPSLADVDITSVITENIGGIEHKGEGVWEVVVDFEEYLPPPAKSIVSTPNGAVAQFSFLTANGGTSVDVPKPPDPIAARIAAKEAELQAAQQEIASL